MTWVFILLSYVFFNSFVICLLLSVWIIKWSEIIKRPGNNQIPGTLWSSCKPTYTWGKHLQMLLYKPGGGLSHSGLGGGPLGSCGMGPGPRGPWGGGPPGGG